MKRYRDMYNPRVQTATSFVAVLTVCLFIHGAAYAATGIITGTVVDMQSGNPVIGASVVVEGTTMGAACDIDGRYLIRDVPTGTHSVIISSLGFTKKVITDVVVKAGETYNLDAGLTTEATELDKIEGTAERAKATESAQLVRRRAAPNVTDGITAETMSRSGDRDAGEAVRRVVGITVVDNKSLVVRGMSGRYSNVVMNGSPLPSPDPESREVELDLFPSGMLQALVASKTFTPDKSANFTGGQVNLVTRDFPNEFSFGFSGSGSYNTSTTGDGMLEYNRTLRDLPQKLANANLLDDEENEDGICINQDDHRVNDADSDDEDDDDYD